MKFKQVAIIGLVAMISALGSVGLYRYLEPETTTYQNSEVADQANVVNPASFVRYTPPVISGLPSEATDFTVAAAITTPAVVHVKTSYTQRAQPNSGMDMFRDFFGDNFNPDWYGGGDQLRQASGSGVIISGDGYIVTNNHVIEDADEIEVILHDRRKLSAELIGTDPSTDLALLKIEDQNHPYVAFGNSDSVVVGQWVLAVGNPFQLQSTVTAGIVSAKGRDINILGRNSRSQPAIESFIQTDAAVNPGNSGGALVNTSGELIGINTAIATPTGTFAGYSFAVPANIVQKVIGDLMNYGIVQRAYLGVMIDIQKDDVGGVFVSDIIEGTAADEANLRTGDIITEINDFKVRSFPELQEQVSKYQPGDEVNVAFKRNGKSFETLLTLKNADKTTGLVEARSALLSKLGFDISPLTEEQKERLDIGSGVQITEIGRGLLSERTRIEEGFVITHINETPVNRTEDMDEALALRNDMAHIEGFYPDSPYKIYNYSLSME
jgi:Do/DeqQ family serine protease